MEGMGRVRGNLRMHQIFRRMSLWLLVSQEDGLGQNWVCMALPHGHGDLGRDKSLVVFTKVLEVWLLVVSVSL